MKELEKIETKKGEVLQVEKTIHDGSIALSIISEYQGNCVLHWGLLRAPAGPWLVPAESLWPEGSEPFRDNAVRTPFRRRDGAADVRFLIDLASGFRFLEFALFYPDEGTWDSNDGKNYRLRIIPPAARAARSPGEVMKTEREGKNVFYEKTWSFDDGAQMALLATREQAAFHITFVTDIESPLVLHWGIARDSRHEWVRPPDRLLSLNSVKLGEKAVQTPLTDSEGLRRLDIEIPAEENLAGIPFVLTRPDTGVWIKDRGNNFFLPLSEPPDYRASLGSADIADIAEEIIEKEMSRNSWTLMHRFNLCFDLLDRVKRGDADGLALLFVWLRYSVLRQLDWQRNYNTKPRELGHSLDRLTLKISGRYVAEPVEQEYIRLIMTTLGRGTDAQRVRDEVLNIMHRHHIKEVSGHFMEEWHQKLHNNATPDDIIICEAFIEFLRSNGDLNLFYGKLEKGGISKKRLESYERPIRSHPDFIPHLKDALIHDLEHFLGILREVHSGTDLGTAIHTARYLFDEEMHHMVDSLWSLRGRSGEDNLPLLQKIIEARVRLLNMLGEHQKGVRDILFLDLALEDFFRSSIESTLHLGRKREDLVVIISLALENLCLTHPNEEFMSALRQWRKLTEMPLFEKDWSLHAKAVMDRLQLALGDFIDRYYRLLQPKAEFLGKAFNAEPWTTRLFTEEVVRGRPAFVLSLLLQKFDPVLRETAELGDWQVISRGGNPGVLEVVESLKSVERGSFSRSTVLLAEKVTGNEEIPPGVSGLVTPASVDVLSHLAVRARNMRVFFAICYDAPTISRLKSLAGHTLRPDINEKGDVLFKEVHETAATKKARPLPARKAVRSPLFSGYAISRGDFTESTVGGKSLHLKHLAGKLPEWIQLPSSAALPFGVFEKVLSLQEHRSTASRHASLLSELADEERGTGKGVPRILEDLRNIPLELTSPEDLIDSLRNVMEGEGIPWPEHWKDAWDCITRVWGSKWNDRAYLSRKANGIPHEDLFMAVLVQRVIDADYSFVIHTASPFTGAKEELYAEVVPGLGEALVGNYPGKALSFSFEKAGKAVELLSYPSKSAGLYGGGLIFRSDSSGEDLEEYAGAGLYDSVMLPPATKVSLDYIDEPLVHNGDFRQHLLTKIGEIGIEVENALGSPQDIEGAYRNGGFFVVQSRPQVGLGDA